MQRVFISGLGLISPLGQDVPSSWQRLCKGDSAAAKIEGFDATGWPMPFACEVKNFTCRSLPKDQQNLLNLPGRYAAEACVEAFQNAGLESAPDPKRSGVIFGTGIGVIRPQEILATFKNYALKPGLPGILAYLEREDLSSHNLQLKNHPATLTAFLSSRYNLGGYCQSISTACSSGAQAIGYGYRRIRDGDADLMLVGGADSLAGELLFAGFWLLGVMSEEKVNPKIAGRPFDKNRSGFVAGEGAAALLIEQEESLLKRGGNPICEIKGYGESENAFRITDLPEDGAEAIQAMNLAVGNLKSRVGCINAHGTATRQNDKVESLAIERVFYDEGESPIVTGNKAQIGHFVAASGAVEAVFSVLTVTDDLIPPLINLDETDCSERIAYAPKQALQKKVEAVLSNSFGFGGTNASLLFSKVR